MAFVTVDVKIKIVVSRIALRSNEVIEIPTIVVYYCHNRVVIRWFIRPGNVLDVWILAVM